MSAPSFAPSPSAAAPTIRVIPPYAGPVYGAGETRAAVRVGPFVPLAQRPAAEPRPEAEPLPSVVGAKVAPEMGGEAMAVPVSIPPYRPLRRTPIASPVIRPPLYIPPVATPAGEEIVADEGVIEPQLIHAAEVHLPWIDAFLASTPALPMAALTDGTEAEVEAELEAEAEAEVEAVASVSPLIPSRSDVEIVEAPPVTVDEWPLDEAAAEFRALRTALDEQGARDGSPDGNGDAVDSVVFAPLSEWRDDDLMDIMPIRHSRHTPLENGAITTESDQWAERAHAAQDEAQRLQSVALTRSAPEELPAVESTAEEAAHALELLARRVRAGELTLPSYDPRMGEPAALVAALAALLGVKLR
jgi:hypothetical protein